MDALYAAAKAGDTAKIKSIEGPLTEKVSKYASTLNSQQEWDVQVHQYAQSRLPAASDHKVEESKKAPQKGGALPKLSDYKKIGGHGRSGDEGEP